VAGLRPRRRSLRLAGGRYTQGMSSSEARGFQKLANLSPEEIRRLFTASGRFHGGLRGALLGGGLGYLTSDKDDTESMLSHTLGGALLGGGIGAGVGHYQGNEYGKGPFRRVTFDDGSVYHYLRRPGAFSDELFHAKYTQPRDLWNEAKQQYLPSTEYVPFRGSSLMEQLLLHKNVPDLT